MLPDRDQSDIEQALAEFDRAFRHQRAWSGWDKRRSQLYAIEYGGQIYPPKQIVSIATGVSVRRFNGGDQTNTYLEKRGFKVIPLAHNLPVSPSALPSFVIGNAYIRSTEITGRFGGSRQSGIAPSRQAPAVFLFTGDSGEKFGYTDTIDEFGVLHYTGEGQQGDMVMASGNAAIADHAREGRALHVFRTTGKGKPCIYLGEFCYGSHAIERGPDLNGKERDVIVFRLLPVSTTLEVESAGLPLSPEDDPEDIPLPSASLDELRRKAVEAISERVCAKDPKEARRVIYERSNLVKAYVLTRAAGCCELCEEEAPFLRKNTATPYLEPHHINRLSDGGLDHPMYVGALCPNCHREIHYGVEGPQLNERLRAYVAEIEAGLES